MDIVLIILILLGLYAIVRIAIGIINSRKCLDDHTIRNYLAGKYQQGSEESRQVTAHLGICQKCRDRMTNFDFKAYAKKVVEEEE